MHNLEVLYLIHQISKRSNQGRYGIGMQVLHCIPTNQAKVHRIVFWHCIVSPDVSTGASSASPVASCVCNSNVLHGFAVRNQLLHWR